MGFILSVSRTVVSRNRGRPEEPGWTTSQTGPKSIWKNQCEQQIAELIGDAQFTVRLTLGTRQGRLEAKQAAGFYIHGQSSVSYRSQDAAFETKGDGKAGLDGRLSTRVGDAERDKQQVEGQNCFYAHSLCRCQSRRQRQCWHGDVSVSRIQTAANHTVTQYRAFAHIQPNTAITWRCKTSYMRQTKYSLSLGYILSTYIVRKLERQVKACEKHQAWQLGSRICSLA